jgi:methyl-accepting chemotaxis protein
VANEVKELAQETARATGDIARRVEAIQRDASGATAAIDEITAIIGRIDDFQTTIASAVEEQSATTAEMNRSVAEAATGSGAIATTIGGVAAAAAMTTEGVGQTRLATGEPARMSSELQALVQRFRYCRRPASGAAAATGRGTHSPVPSEPSIPASGTA